MDLVNQRSPAPDRRRVPRGGRRLHDRAGAYPVLLVAESCNDVRRPLVRYLERFRFRVAEAERGHEILTVIARAHPHVILIESRFPHMAASRLLQWLAQGAHTAHIPVIVLADEAPDDPHEEHRPAAVLVKPFSLVTMLDEVRRTLRPPVVSIARAPGGD